MMGNARRTSQRKKTKNFQWPSPDFKVDFKVEKKPKISKMEISRDIKREPDLNDLRFHLKRNFKAEPGFQRRNFTAGRKLKAKAFLQLVEEEPECYGLPGSGKWLKALLHSMNEPNSVNLDNVREWAILHSAFFGLDDFLESGFKDVKSERNENRPELREETGNRLKRPYQTPPVPTTRVTRKTAKARYESPEDSDSSSSSSDIFEPVIRIPNKRRCVEPRKDNPEKKQEVVESPKPVKIEETRSLPPLPKDVSLSELDPLDDDVFEIPDVDLVTPPNSPSTGVILPPLHKEEDIKKLIESKSNSKHAYFGNDGKKAPLKFQQSSPIYEVTDDEDDDGKQSQTNKEDDGETTPASADFEVPEEDEGLTRTSDSGLGSCSEEPNHVDKEQSSTNSKIEKSAFSYQSPQQFIVNSGDFFDLASAIGSFDIIKSPGSPQKMAFNVANVISVPNSEVETVQNIVEKYNSVLNSLQSLQDNFEIWHGFCIEPRNMIISNLFDSLRANFDEMQMQLVSHICSKNM